MNNSAIVLTNRFGKEYSYFAERIINAIAKEHKHKKMVTHTSFNVCLFSEKITLKSAEELKMNYL